MFYSQTLFLAFWLYVIYSISFVQAAGRKPRIVGSDPAEYINFPYNVYIFKKNPNNERGGMCTGSILDDNHVITAAHCFVNTESPYTWRDGEYNVRAGATDVFDTKDNKIVTVNVQKVYIPKLFKDSLQNKDVLRIGDVAVLKLETSLNLMVHSHLKTVQVLKNDHISYVNKTALTSGYGVNQGQMHWYGWKGSFDGKLRAANVTVISNEACQNKWDDSKMIDKFTITEKHICVEFDQKDDISPKATCDGDSGGPLIYLKNILIGLTQSGMPDCNHNDKAPTIYSRVSEFENFIEKAKNYNGDASDNSEILMTTFPIESNKLLGDQ